MSEPVIAALVAAAVALLVSLLTHAFERRRLASEETRHSRDLRRRLTERLLDIRLLAYPKAFAITDRLRADLILSPGNDVQPTYVRGVLEELLAWQRDHAGFVLTKDSLSTYRALRASLSVKPANGQSYSREQREHMFKCKNRFRGALKADLTLLYEEDRRTDDREDTED